MVAISTLLRSTPRFSCSVSPHKRRRLSSVAQGPPYKVLFFGADSFSCAILNALSGARGGLIDELVVVTPPPSRKDKGLKNVYVPPLHTLAEKLNLRTISLPPEGLKNWVPPSSFPSASPSALLITASFGHLIPSPLLSHFAPLHSLNVHPSLLPKYRGAAPIQWTIVNGDTVSGVSVQELSKGTFDKGRLLGQVELTLPKDPEYDALELLLAERGGSLLLDVLENFESAKANTTLQDPSKATLAPKIKKEHARIDWAASSAEELERLQRGVAHHFPLWTTLTSSPTMPIQLLLARASPPVLKGLEDAPPGTVIYEKREKRLIVRTKEGEVVVEKVKPAGKGWKNAAEWWNGVPQERGRARFV